MSDESEAKIPFWRDAAEARLKRWRAMEEEQTEIRRAGRKLGKLPQGVIQGLRRCNPLQLKEAIKQCRQFIRDHRTPPDSNECPSRGRKPVLRVKVRNQLFQVEWQLSCGKQSCTKCPHGPYVYGYHRDGSIIRTTYYGRPPFKRKPPRKVLAAIQTYNEKHSR